MKSFQFPLQRVLDWRALQMRSEEEKLAALQAKLAALVHRENELTAAQLKCEMKLLAQESLDGSDLHALAAFQLRIRNERAAIQIARTKYEAQAVEQRKRLLKARKECRVLENLKEKRWKTWTYLSDREVETTAAESYISRWLRTNAEG